MFNRHWLVVVLSALLVSLLLTSCANSVRVSDAEPAPVTGSFNPEIKANGETASIVVVRDAGFLATLLDVVVYLNNNIIGTLRPGQKVSINIPPGDYVIGVGCKPCNDDYRSELQLAAIKGKRRAFRVSFIDGLRIQASAMINE